MDDAQAIEEWTRAQQRVLDLVAGLSPEQTAVRVPACPDWTVHDLLAHMIGLDVDVLDGDEPDDHNETWTQAQVDARRDHTLADLLEEWRGTTEPLRAWMRENTIRPLNDAVIHEQDLRGALGVPGGTDSPAFAALRELFLGRFADRLGDLAPIALVGPGFSWCSAGSVDDAAVLLRAGDADLTRALMARRSARQLRAWTERGDVTPYLSAFGTLGPLPEADLTE